MTDSAYDWEELDTVEKHNREVEAARRRKAAAYHHVFAQDKMGQKILQEWVTMFCTGEPAGPGASEREVGMMDGKRQIVKMILDQITIATTGENDDA